MLKIGTNNLYGDHNAGTDEEFSEGIRAVVAEVRKRLPNAKVLVRGILPRENECFSGRIARINGMISDLDDGQGVRFLDLGQKFQRMEGQGDVFEDIYHADKLNLSAQGYEVLGEAIAPVVTEMSR